MTHEALSKMEPVAFRYELGAHKNLDGQYCEWVACLSDYQPVVPHEAIRNLVALYALSPSHIERVREMEAVMFDRLRDAYLRGASWRDANGSLELAYKAACDYADYETSPATAVDRAALSVAKEPT